MPRPERDETWGTDNPDLAISQTGLGPIRAINVIEVTLTENFNRILAKLAA